MSPLILDHSNVRQRARRRFLITPAKPKDARRLVDIEFRAFENEQTNQVLSFRDNKDPMHFQRSVNIYATAISKERAARRKSALKSAYPAAQFDEEDTSSVSFKTVVSIESGETVSFAKVEMKTYTKQELESPADSGHEHEPQMNRDWFALNERARREYVGTTPHCYIGMLATEPKHQQHGAGTMLLEEILAEADDAGVEVYLEATDTAKPLYERHGFVALTEIRFDPAEYGVTGVGRERQTVMVRGALGINGIRNKVKSWEEVTGKPHAS